MLPPNFFVSIVSLFALHLGPVVLAQYLQDFDAQNIPSTSGGTGSAQAYFYQPTYNDAPNQVVDLSPQRVYLIYNCYYMKDICKNAANFYTTQRGLVLHPRSGLPTYVFGYDFSTGKSLSRWRSANRREHSCPSKRQPMWKDFHFCPESNQRTVMRHDGAWYTTALEDPDEDPLAIKNRYLPNGQLAELSKIRYSCDEFPPATWVEGGDDTDGTGQSQTRCAAIRCGEGVKAEQDWQATAHNGLQNEIKRLVNARRRDYGQFPYWQAKNSVVLFGFTMNNEPDNIAARIWTYSDPALSQIEHETDVSQGFRRDGVVVDGNTTVPEWKPWPSELDYDELLGHVRSGLISEQVVVAYPNDTSSMAMGHMTGGPLGGMPLQFRWDESEDEFEGEYPEDEDEDVEHVQLRKDEETPPPLDPIKRQPLPLVLRNTSDPTITPLLKSASLQDVDVARSIVEEAIAKSSELNAARLASPVRNQYGLRPGTIIGGDTVPQGKRDVAQVAILPLLDITDAIAEAAALVAEADATSEAGNANVTKRAVAASGSYWMGSLARKGTVPWGDDPSYKVFRSVLDYGAVGDGVTDDTKAIKSAMTDGSRCGKGCNGSTTKNAIVYFPPGRYLISSSIPMPFGTQVIGDAVSRPTLVASKSFIGLGVLSADEYTGGGTGTDGLDQQYYVNTANFYRQIRNVVIDITSTRDSQKVAGIHYQVAQATSMQNVDIVAAAGATGQRGIYAENGSGGQISDVNFVGGAFGIYGGNQQFTAQRLTFDGCGVGVQVFWDWGWVWKSVTMKNVGIGFKLVSETESSGNIGSVSVMDSSFANVATAAVVIAPASSATGSGSTGVVLENVKLSGVAAAVADTSGKIMLDGSAAVVDQWALGPIYEGSADERTFSMGEKTGSYRRHQNLLDAAGNYFERARPQYEDRGVGDFVHVKDFGAAGDGSTDDTAAFQTALYASLGQVLFVDAGSYILTSTVTVPAGSKIVGETWSQLVASGAYFEDASNPQVMLQVGKKGDVGDVEMQDLLFTTRGGTAGLVLVEWNIKAASPGSAGLWDCHARIGGATGTELTPAECPALTSGATPQGCSAASLMMHLTSSGSGYFENMWLWGSDHMIDDPDLNDANNTMVQNSIFVARGFLIESTEPTWLYGTASEHAVFYQYNFNKATQLFAGMLQTESPYFQPSPPPPAPFQAIVGDFPGDPDYTCTAGDDFGGCDESWGVIIRESANIFVAGAGVYSWFSSYAQDCIDTQQCQKALLLLDSNYANVRIQHLITIGAKYMAVMDGKGIAAEDNLNVDTHPFWSQISILDVGSNGTQFSELVWIDPAIWDMDQPAFTCSPPCNVKIPPWTKATSTVNYPLLTVSDGTWTSTITKAPLTISAWVFELVTLTQGSSNSDNAKLKRQGFDAFMPKPATTPFWPSVTYNGPDGSETTVGPTVAFPTPPASIGPDAPPPPTGSWPKREVQPYMGGNDFPFVNECSYFDFLCVGDPWIYGENGTSTGGGDDDGDTFDENWEEVLSTCRLKSSSSSSSTTTSSTTTTTIETPEPSPYEEGDPMQNELSCYGSGETTEGTRMRNGATSFCNQLGSTGDVLAENYFHQSKQDFDFNGGIGTVEIVLSLEIKPNCQWTWDLGECQRYLAVPTDACNCGGVNGKQGGVVTNNCYEWRIDPNRII